MAAWPESLPKCAIPDTRMTTYANGVTEFATDGGRPLRRVSTSGSDRIFGGTFRMTTAQLADFWTFYNVTVSRGVNAFTMRDPEAGADVSVIFDDGAPPVARTIMRGRHDIALSFRVVG